MNKRMMIHLESGTNKKQLNLQYNLSKNVERTMGKLCI